jgi:hypothetical protein
MFMRYPCVPRSACVFLAAAFLSLPAFFIYLELLSPSAFAQRMPREATFEKVGSATIGVCNSSGLDVEANGVSTSYTSLAAAFGNINLGIHTGEIVIEVCGDTTHTGSAVINSSGAASTNYSSVLIRPLVDGVRISSATLAGRGVIELNGADNVTIDGDNPLTPGINRDLTIENTAASSTTYTSVLRIAMNQSHVYALTANDNAFKNLRLIGSARGQNLNSVTSATSSAGVTYGIYASSGGNDTQAPGAVTSATTTIGGSASAGNLQVENNEILAVGRGLSLQGNADNVFSNLLIKNNLVGNPTTGHADQVYAVGISVRGSTGALVEGNDLWIESYLAFSSPGGIRALDHGFLVSSDTGVGNGTRFERNRIFRVRNNHPGNYGVTGIALSRGNNHRVINNFVMGVLNNNVTRNGFNPNDSAAGIRTVSSGVNHKIFHNSVHLTGEMQGSFGATLSAALALWVTTANPERLEVRNNILSNQISGGHPDSKHVAIYLPSSLGWNYNAVIDNNAYFQGSASNSRLAHHGTNPSINSYLAENFNPNERVSQENFRTYSYGLIDDFLHQNDSNSFASMAPPPFVSDTDLHLVPGSGFQIEAGGADVGVAADIDGDVRGQAPEIGADELFAPTSAGVSITGRVATAGGRGIYGARVTLSGAGGTLYAVTNPFGYYRFTGLGAGGSAAVTVSAKGRTFAVPTRFVSLEDDIAGVDFIADR